MAQIKVFSNKKFEKLTPKQIRAIELLINCEKKQKEIAEEIKVSERTLYNWMHHNEEFRNAMEWYRKEVYRTHAPEAVDTIIKLMRNGTSDSIKLAAAQDLLSRAGDDAASVVDLKSENQWEINVRTVESVD